MLDLVDVACTRRAMLLRELAFAEIDLPGARRRLSASCKDASDRHDLIFPKC
jgi:hypothetical protein